MPHRKSFLKEEARLLTPTGRAVMLTVLQKVFNKAVRPAPMSGLSHLQISTQPLLHLETEKAICNGGLLCHMYCIRLRRAGDPPPKVILDKKTRKAMKRAERLKHRAEAEASAGRST